MKTILALLIVILTARVQAQDFDKNMATAKTAYASGNLEDSRFAMQQMLNDIDMLVGKQILKQLPAKMDAMAAVVAQDNVTANSGFSGVVIHRDYGTEPKTALVDIIGNSPLVASVNAILSIPFIGNSSDGTQKVVKVQGYKGVLQKSVDTETNKTDFTLQIPVNAALLTFTMTETTEADILRLANTLPVAQIAKLIQ